MPKIDTVKTKAIGDGAIQINKLSVAYFKNGAIADLFEVSCYKKGAKTDRFGVELFLTSDRAYDVFERRVASPDPSVISRDRNSIAPEMIERFS